MVFRSPAGSRRASDSANIASIAALDEPVRAALLEFVSRSRGEVSRDQAADALGVSRRVAAFQLDRLAAEGWLDVGFRRLTGRTGPGAGRSSKLYRRSAKQVEVSVPRRNYELMARLLASAAQQHAGAGAVRQLEPGAKRFGSAIGASVKAGAGRAVGQEVLVRALFDELAAYGFEPYLDSDRTVRLQNCPYHDMAQENTEVVCAMNLALMQGIAEGLGLTELKARLEPREGMCCVAFRTAGRGASTS